MDASLGDLGVWLAFAASVVGAIVIAVGLVRTRGVATPGADLLPIGASVGAGASEGAGAGAELSANASASPSPVPRICSEITKELR